MKLIRTSSVLLAAGVISLLPGAAHASPRSDAARLPKLLLRDSEVPDGFKRTTDTAYTPAELVDQETWTAEQLRSWGYVAGHERQFQRTKGTTSQISSDAGAFKSRGGARRSLAQNTANCRIDGWKLLKTDVGLADQSRLCRLYTTIGDRKAVVYFVVWRHGRFKGSVTYTAPRGKLRVAEAVRLASVQARKR